MDRITSEEELRQAIGYLLNAEPRFEAVVERHGLPPLRRVEPGLESILRIVTDQLISLKAGQAIWARLEKRLAPFTPEEVAVIPEDELRALGLSGAKARTFRAVAKAACEGRFDPSHMSGIDNPDVLAKLTALPGIGPWTAEIYMLTALSRADVWPAGDLALQVAAQDLLSLGQRPDARTLRALAEPWKPVRAAAALLLWSHYRGLKGMEQRVI